MLDQIKALGPSVIRTVTSWLIAKALLLVAALAGVPWLSELLTDALNSEGVRVFLETAVATGWYAIFRWLETQRDSRWGWLLGLPGAPSYEAPATADEGGQGV